MKAVLWKTIWAPSEKIFEAHKNSSSEFYQKRISFDKNKKIRILRFVACNKIKRFKGTYISDFTFFYINSVFFQDPLIFVLIFSQQILIPDQVITHNALKKDTWVETVTKSQHLYFTENKLHTFRFQY